MRTVLDCGSHRHVAEDRQCLAKVRHLAPGKAAGRPGSGLVLDHSPHGSGRSGDRQPDSDDRFQCGAGAHQGYGSRERRCHHLLACRRCREGGARHHQLSRGDRPGGADVTARNDRLLDARESPVGPQRCRRTAESRNRNQNGAVGHLSYIGRNTRCRDSGGAAGCDVAAGAGGTRETGARDPRIGRVGDREPVRAGRSDLRWTPMGAAAARDEHHLRNHQGARRHDSHAEFHGRQLESFHRRSGLGARRQ